MICSIGLWATALPASAQQFNRPSWTSRYNRTETNDLGLWPQTMFNYQHGKYIFEYDVNPRLQYNVSRLQEVQMRAFVGYKAKPWMSMWVGCYPWTPTFEPTEFSETRLLQQVGLEKMIGRFALTMRNRLEQRWIEHTNNRTSWRIRAMPRVNYFIDEKKSIYLFTANELFVNLNTINTAIRTGVAQNRLYVGAGMRINNHTNIEVSYLNQWIHRRYHAINVPNRFNHNIVINLVKNYW